MKTFLMNRERWKQKKQITDLACTETHFSSGIPVQGSPRMLGSYNGTAHSFLASELLQRTTHTHFKIDSFQFQNTIYLIVIVHIIYIIGIPGNILTLIVLQKKTLNDNFVSVFLSAMCIVDLYCLITGFSAYWWMAVTLGRDFREESEVACFYHWFVTMMGSQANEWLMVLVSACRIHVIASRSRIQSHQSRTCGFLILGGIFTVILLPGFFMIRSTVTTNYVDGSILLLVVLFLISIIILLREIADCDFDIVDDLSIIYFAITHFLPPIIVIVENFVMYYLYRKKMPPIMRLRPANIAANQRMKMLIVMTDIMFFVTNIPPLVFHEVSRNMFQPNDIITAASRKFEISLMFTALYCGFAFNVVIYCCFGRRFRSELKMLLLIPIQRLGYCKGRRIKETGSIRHPMHIPFSVYTTSGSNPSEAIAANTLGLSEKQLGDNQLCDKQLGDNQLGDKQLESLEPAVSPVLSREEDRNVNLAELTRNFRKRQSEEPFLPSSVIVDKH